MEKIQADRNAVTVCWEQMCQLYIKSRYLALLVSLKIWCHPSRWSLLMIINLDSTSNSTQIWQDWVDFWLDLTDLSWYIVYKLNSFARFCPIIFSRGNPYTWIPVNKQNKMRWHVETIFSIQKSTHKPIFPLSKGLIPSILGVTALPWFSLYVLT